MLLKACEAIEHEAGEGLEGGLVDQSSELEDNEAYLYKNLESDEDSSEDDWLEEDSKCEDSDTEATGSILHQSALHAMQIQKQLTQRLYILFFCRNTSSVPSTASSLSSKLHLACSARSHCSLSSSVVSGSSTRPDSEVVSTPGLFAMPCCG